MNVLFQNRAPERWAGGDMIQMEKTRALLGGGFSSDLLPDLSKTDIVHLWNFNQTWTRAQLEWATFQGKKTVISMIYNEGIIPYQEQQAMVNKADRLIFLHEGELARARRNIDIPDEKIVIIPNGIEKEWFVPFRKGDYVLTVGRLDGTKGQLETAQACKSLGKRFVCVGEPLDTNYASQVKNEGAEVIGSVDRHDLIPYYSGCAVFVLASKTEVMPLTVMEAGAQGKAIVLTEKCEWEIPDTEYVPQDPAAIAIAIENQWNREAVELRRMLEGMTWEKVAEKIKSVYEGLDRDAPR